MEQGKLVDLFILGLLSRHGPQHGYRLRQLIAVQAADFSGIKLPTVYYHLRRLAEKGLLRTKSEAAGRRPERTVYLLSQRGKKVLAELTKAALHAEYHPSFAIDAALFLSEPENVGEILHALEQRDRAMCEKIDYLDRHREEVLPHLPPARRLFASLIFEHHALHFKAEREWVLRCIEQLSGGTSPERQAAEKE